MFHVHGVFLYQRYAFVISPYQFHSFLCRKNTHVPLTVLGGGWPHNTPYVARFAEKFRSGVNLFRKNKILMTDHRGICSIKVTRAASLLIGHS